MRKRPYITVILIVILAHSVTLARTAFYPDDKLDTTAYSAASPAYGIVGHRVGKIVLAVSNNGTFGDGLAPTSTDYFTGKDVPSCEYPKGSATKYLFGAAFWIGAVVGRDTLVSTAADGWDRAVREFHPDSEPFGRIIKRSISDPTVPGYEEAISEEDYVMEYMDTLTQGVPSDFFGQPYKPLFIKATQRSYAWSYAYAEDFVLFDYTITNIGRQKLENVYMGIYVDADVYMAGDEDSRGYDDDICGFIDTMSTYYYGCRYVDTVNIAWIADNDGDPEGGQYVGTSLPAVTGTRIVRTPADSLDVSFNWWISNMDVKYDFGPREKALAGRWPEEFRDFRTGGLGTPEGNANKYYTLRNREFDYDQVFVASIQSDDNLWLYPPQKMVESWATGMDTRYLLSFGPFNISPGEKLPISFAYVGGEDLHVDPYNASKLPGNPWGYYQNLDFSDFAVNAGWADRVYDNPGVDTDNDGYFGKTRICCTDTVMIEIDTVIDDVDTTITIFDPQYCDTFYYQGDGVADFRGAAPPPSPKVWLEPKEGSIRVRFNGQVSETTRDIFSRIADFEGYRVYLGRDERETSYSLATSYDIEDYNKMVWNANKRPEPGWQLYDIPYTLDSLRCLYGQSCDDSSFQPLDYSRTFPYIHPQFPDSVFYFMAQDFNVSNESARSSIHKVYPQQPYPSNLNPDSAGTDELTADGYFKYFEYECYLDNLLPTVEWWISVTAFDFGSPESGLASLEGAIAGNGQSAFATMTARDVAAGGLSVYVYPNPYRIDGTYRDLGFEGRTDPARPDNRVRAINFANLPHKCTISIYSLDGDLIRQIEHDRDIDDPTASHDYWDLITRNTQEIVSGLYYWTVESEDGEVQVGKLAIIM